jgi:hypothetical protein
MGLGLDLTIRISDLILAAGVLGGGLISFVLMRQELKHHGHRLYLVEGEIHKQTDILVDLARQNERMAGIDRRLEFLERDTARS